MNDYTYKLGFAFAITLHVVLALFLLVKFTSSRSVALTPGSFINAVVINEHDFNKQVARLVPNILPKPKEENTKPVPPEQITKPQPVVPNIKPQIKDHIKDTLQKNLLMEQAKEMAALKKERQAYKKAQQQQQMQKILQEQAQAEQKELASEQAGAANAEAQGEVDKYKAMVIQAISSQWSYPAEVVDGKVSGRLLIKIDLSGKVLSVQLLDSSGNSVLDRSAQAAVFKASPLPLPDDLKLFDDLLKVTFTPQGFV